MVERGWVYKRWGGARGQVRIRVLRRVAYNSAIRPPNREPKSADFDISCSNYAAWVWSFGSRPLLAVHERGF